jgi:ATP-dependent Clp protease ATP-binding subunit ClpA
VPTKAGDLIPDGIRPFSRFTARAAQVLAAAGRLAAPEPVNGAHLAAALLTEPGGLAAMAVAAAGVTPEQVYAAVGAGPAPRVERAGTAELLDVTLDESTKDALKAGLKSALRLGHNYIGTEHLLLGLLSRGGPVTDAFTTLGLPLERAEELITAELTALQASKEAN